jgi:hypothetical protein
VLAEIAAPQRGLRIMPRIGAATARERWLCWVAGERSSSLG